MRVTGRSGASGDAGDGDGLGLQSGTDHLRDQPDHAVGPGSGQTGKDWLQQALGTRSEQLSHFANLNQSEAQALVDAEFAQRTRRFVVARGVAEGNPNLRVGSWLTLTGMGPRFSNTYYTTATVHQFDTEEGYRTEFTAECAYLGAAS